jgi:uncharacterized OB-fold protein
MKTLLRPPTIETASFWEACRAGRLQLRCCAACAHVFYYPRLYCPRCGAADIGERDAQGLGTIYSFTRVHYSPFGDYWKDQLPYTVVQVDLVEGVRMLSRLISPEGLQPRIGQAVWLRFEPVGEGMRLPVFELEPDPS